MYICKDLDLPTHSAKQLNEGDENVRMLGQVNKSSSDLIKSDTLVSTVEKKVDIEFAPVWYGDEQVLTAICTAW